MVGYGAVYYSGVICNGGLDVVGVVAIGICTRNKE